MNPFGIVQARERDARHVHAVRQAVQRAMQRVLDPRSDREVLRRVSSELHTGEDLVAQQLAFLRLQASSQVISRERDRAVSAGLTPAAAARISNLAGVQAAALATRDALLRARARQQDRMAHQRQLAEVFTEQQEIALMERYEQSDEQLADDFEDAVRELATGEGPGQYEAAPRAAG